MHYLIKMSKKIKSNKDTQVSKRETQQAIWATLTILIFAILYAGMFLLIIYGLYRLVRFIFF